MATPDICPVCGTAVPNGARACPACGADDATGWDAASRVNDGLDLPDTEFDYNAYLEREFGGQGKPAKKLWPWLCVAAVIFVLIVLMLARRS